ncbi:MAG: SGNH/GDSL hydrolase family protein [Burkholderiales bacterium]
MIARTLAFGRVLPPALAAMVAGASLAAAGWRWYRLTQLMRIGDRLADAAVAFERPAAGHAATVLVIGDSTGVGTGAARPEDSIAGQLAAQFPHAAIVNRARNGARTFDALLQIVDAGITRYDLVLIHVGGNDVLRRTPLAALGPQVEALMLRASRLSDHVVLTTTPNVGLVPAFVPPLSWWLTRRSRDVCRLFADAARRHGAHYVDFFHPKATDPFSREPGRFFAEDGLHPSTDCYRYVYEALVARSPIATALAPRPGAVR